MLDCIHVLFNMDGSPISDGEVGLLDKHHLWCYFLDPFSHLWLSTFKIEGSLWVHVREMIAHVAPLYAPQALLRREALLEEFEVVLFLFIPFHLWIILLGQSFYFLVKIVQEFWTHEGRWTILWDLVVLDNVNLEEPEFRNGNFDLERVQE